MYVVVGGFVAAGHADAAVDVDVGVVVSPLRALRMPGCHRRQRKSMCPVSPAFDDAWRNERRSVVSAVSAVSAP